MSADEMASDEMKQVRERLAKEAFNDHQMTFVAGTHTDQFQCSNCKKNNTTYNEVRSACELTGRSIEVHLVLDGCQYITVPLFPAE